MKNLLRLFYVSKITGRLGKADISDILEKSSANNAKLGITGVLCYRGGYFAQILEGEELAVLEMYLKVAKDKRHHDLIIVSISTIVNRIFNGWAMGGIAEDKIPFIKVDDILDLRNSGIESHAASAQMQQWLKLLESQSGL